MNRIILASQSPRRRALLSAMGVEFETIPSNYEEHLDDSRDAETVAKELSLGKAMDIALKNLDAYVIGSDTIVTIDGVQLEKPVDEAEAKATLKLLSGRVNYVTTGLAVVNINKNIELLDAETSNVYFGPYDKAAVEAYVATGDPMTKAGSYAIQALLGTLITHVEGNMDAIIGLPTERLVALLKQCGIDSHPVEERDLILAQK